MNKSILEVVFGDLDEKNAYRQKMKRVKALPENYRTAFKKIQISTLPKDYQFVLNYHSLPKSPFYAIYQTHYIIKSTIFPCFCPHRTKTRESF